MKNKIKKILIIFLILIIAFQLFQKFDFLLFKIKICNNTSSKMLIGIYGNKKQIINLNFNNFLEKIFHNYKKPINQGKKISYLLDSNTCGNFNNTNLFSNNFNIRANLFKNGIIDIECISGTTDLPDSIKNLSLGKYIINIDNYKIKKIIKNGIEYKYCNLYKSIKKVD